MLIARKWLIAAVCGLCGLAILILALFQEPKYRAEATLALADSDRMAEIPPGLSGLAGLAGVNLGGPRDSSHALAILRSRGFVADFIEKYDLLPVLFADKWNSEESSWIPLEPDEVPDTRDGVHFFIEDVRYVTQETDTGLITLAIEWRDPAVAAEWIVLMVTQVNEQLREKDLEESRRRLEYLNGQLQQTELVELRQGISRLIENQIETVMLAQAEEEYAFRIIDEPIIPKDPVSPKVILMTVIGTVFGFVGGCFIAIFNWWLGRDQLSDR